MGKKLKTIAQITIGIAAVAAAVAGILEIIENWKKNTPYKGLYANYFKRPLDVFLSTGALIVFSPILFVTALLVHMKLGSPILFAQERPGKNKKIFKLYKFRTMADKVDANGNLLPDGERLTPFGKALRSTSLDEMPELINIVKGDMAVVGPRPLLVKYLSLYNEHQARRHEVRPGFTGLAQIHGRNAISWEEKLDWDVKYVDNVTFRSDAKIIWNTLKVVLKKDGISGGESVTMTEFMGNAEQ